MEMFNPPHPGEILREDLPPASQFDRDRGSQGARRFARILSELLNGHNGISADMAIRLEKAGFGSAKSWLRNQLSYDLWHARRRAKAIKVKPFPAP